MGSRVYDKGYVGEGCCKVEVIALHNRESPRVSSDFFLCGGVVINREIREIREIRD